MDSQLSTGLLKTLLECPVCLETLTPPVTQCTRGHVVCGKCRRHLQICHSCRQPLRSGPHEIRNLALENILAGQLFRCGHNGCSEDLSINALGRHERICPHNPTPSPNNEPEPEPEVVAQHTSQPLASAPAPAAGQPGSGAVAVSWVAASHGHVPQGSLAGGYDGDLEIIVARTEYAGALTPGKLIAEHGMCHVPWGGQEHSISHYEALVVPADAVSWIASGGNHVPENAVLGGWSEDGEPLYIGRTIYGDTLTTGKFQPSHGSLYISYGGDEIAHQNFEILVLN